MKGGIETMQSMKTNPMQAMNTNHRTVVPAPAWALELLRERRISSDLQGLTLPALPGLEVAECPFEAWLEAGGDRRLMPRPLPSAATVH